MDISRKMALAAPLWVASIVAASPASADLLDGLTGTESWDRRTAEDPEMEWREWLRARTTQRNGSSEIRIQRVRSHHLAVLMRRSGDRPDFRRIRSIVRSRRTAPSTRYASPRTVAPAKPAARPAPPSKAAPRRRHGRKGPGKGILGVRSRRRGKGPTIKDRTPEPPTWVQVPVERLDDKGQAIDSEGDAELQRAAGQSSR